MENHLTIPYREQITFWDEIDYITESQDGYEVFPHLGFDAGLQGHREVRLCRYKASEKHQLNSGIRAKSIAERMVIESFKRVGLE